MNRRSATRRVGACAALCVALLGPVVGGGSAPAAADPGSKDLRVRAAQLRKSLKAIDDELRSALSKYTKAQDAETRAVAHSFEAAERADAAATAHAEAASAAASRTRALYMNGGQLAVLATVLQAPDLHDAISRYQNVSAVVAGDRQRVDALTDTARAAEAAREQHRAAARDTITAAKQAQAAAAAVERLLAKQAALLERTDAELRAVVEAEARRAREIAARELAARAAAAAAAARAAQAAALASPGTAPGAAPDLVPGPVYAGPDGRYACPVGRVHSFVDTWHAPRSGGRLHQGTDVFAPHGSPAYAVTDGVIDKWGNGGLGGITLWLRAANGDRFYYAHNAVNIATVGTRVKAGDVIARVGQTGNAATTPPHIHFEAHPGGGEARNPYPFLKAICG